MNVLVPGLSPGKVIRRIEETEELSQYSIVALMNMYDYQVAKRARLDRHHGNLSCFLAYEVDLYEQMRLARRMQKVERNIEITEQRIKRLGAEILSRRIRAQKGSP